MRWLTSPALLLLALPGTLMAQRTETGFLDRRVQVEGLELRYQVYVPAEYDGSAAWPVVLFLHGAGERGTDGLRQTQVGLGAAVRSNPARFPAIIVMPQAPPDSSWTGTVSRAALAALEAVEAEYRTDPERVYLTGMSMGGHGAWYLAYRHPERFAALVPICGWVATPITLNREPVVPAAEGPPFEALGRRLRQVPTWIFHGEMDGVVPVGESRAAAAALRDAGAVDARYSELPGVDHNSWDPAYGSAQLTEWLFAQRRGGGGS